VVIVGAAVCPGAPFLLDGSADTLARRADDVVVACRDAVGALRDADVILLLAAGRSRCATGVPVSANAAPRVFPPGSLLGAAGVQRSDRGAWPVLTLPAVGAPDAAAAPVPDPAVGTVVGASLLAAAGITAPVTAVEIADGGYDASALMTQLTDRPAEGSGVGVLVIADGSACHGDFAPGKRNDGAGSFDRAVADALEAGDPGALARACGDFRSARDLLATVEPLATLALLTADRPPGRAHLFFSGAPFGVGYLVSLWQWP
jgi:hypothetical protein